MEPSLRKMLSTMAEFIGWSIGPDFEVVVFDYSEGRLSLVTVANNFGGRPICSASTAFTEKLIAEQKYIHSDYVIHKYNITDDGKPFRCCCFFIKDDEGALQGAVAINFDQQRYQNITNEIYKLCHPNRFIDSAGIVISSMHETYGVAAGIDGSAPPEPKENLHELVTKLTGGTSLSSLSPAERQRLVRELDRQKVFEVKGAVKRVANLLHCSPSSIYRYLSQNE